MSSWARPPTCGSTVFPTEDANPLSASLTVRFLGLCLGPMQTDFLSTISYPLALGQSELGQGLNRFLD